MRSPRRVASYRVSLYFGLLAGLLGCTDTVFRDREPFNPPPDAANKFLGFFTASDYFTFVKDGFDVLYREGRPQPKMMSDSSYDQTLASVGNIPTAGAWSSAAATCSTAIGYSART